RREDAVGPAAGAEGVLREVEPEEVQLVRGAVRVTEDEVSLDRAFVRQDARLDAVVGGVLPVRRAGPPVRAARGRRGGQAQVGEEVGAEPVLGGRGGDGARGRRGGRRRTLPAHLAPLRVRAAGGEEEQGQDERGTGVARHRGSWWGGW